MSDDEDRTYLERVFLEELAIEVSIVREFTEDDDSEMMEFDSPHFF